MIKIKHLNRETTITLQHYLENWALELYIEYDELADLFDVEIGDKAPVLLKYWSGVNDNAVYLHVGSKILAIVGAVEIC